MSGKSGFSAAVIALFVLAVGNSPLPALADDTMMEQMHEMHPNCPMMEGKGNAAMHDMMMHHHMGASSMPFDLTRSLHIFTPMPNGGEQDVVSTDGDVTQIALIRTHLKTEAERRAHGDYGTPAHIHGPSMPGMAEMASGAANLHVEYAQLPAGGRIIYTTTRPALVRAVHAWLDAQAHDHAGDAMLSHQ
ncbi:hypothetical protein [Komagataeibacter sp. FNDCR2]|uniref:hypothetical protein n=1 Tax=Komagataeibacter sp. FNDCR2 TaxID=2878682 RepID=UPI001E2DCE4C|nr:hypothetical protein [Komagataeibacter sp. FNDCR2]MCE2574328.1 hypothetical protein [Komagataeibacter sp. FNDCR2]